MMARVLTPFHLNMATVLVAVVLGVEIERRDDECAHLNNTTFRQRHQLQVQYLLLTRANADCPRLFSQGDPVNHTQQATPFNCSRTTKLIVHGYRAMGSRPSWVEELARALLRAEDSNVLVVDWVFGASFAYNLVLENYKEVAVQVSTLINKLQDQGCKLESFHLIGVSLGAHVAGFIGTIFQGKIGRITGLDPAGPMFKKANLFDRLDPSDALFVEAIHTDSDYFGISIPVGHVDFFLNGGMDQVGCTRSNFDSVLVYFPVYGYVICDHMRALYVYISVLNGSCPLTGIPCSDYEEFLQGRCLSCNGPCPTIGLLKNSGMTAAPLPTEQKFFLLTTSEPPYCANQVLLEVRVRRMEKRGRLEATLRTDSLATNHKFILDTESVVYRRVLVLPSPLCEVDSIQLKSTGLRFYRQGDIHVESVCITPIPAARPEEAMCVNNIDVRRGTPWSHDYVQVCDDY
ncbi:phospholipase A1 member A isoform X2 [Gadus macrocephalus]|uniref:phospholipase A1 member A isoform X2 n=1 Tax=Gadus macrocephalus TaxID=80720 RepID=UPI0028CB86E4|nr:phospholipase A1 member A isoform X2 [Gadus macrocephalus]